MSKKKEGVVPWGDPPPTRRSVLPWEEIAEQCREEPMRWAEVMVNGPVSLAKSARQGDVYAVRPGLGFEFQQSETDRAHGTCTLHVRWNPDLVDPTAQALLQAREGRKR